jgi:hypothetical protein
MKLAENIKTELTGRMEAEKKKQEELKKSEEEAIRKAKIDEAKRLLEAEGLKVEKIPLKINIVEPEPRVAEQASQQSAYIPPVPPKNIPRGGVQAYDASKEPISDKPPKGIMGIIGSPILLIMFMGVICWVMIQIFGAGVDVATYRSDITRLELDLVAIRANIDNSNKSLVNMQDQLNRMNTTLNTVPSSAKLNELDKDFEALNTLITSKLNSLTVIENDIKNLKQRTTALEAK